MKEFHTFVQVVWQLSITSSGAGLPLNTNTVQAAQQQLEFLVCISYISGQSQIIFVPCKVSSADFLFIAWCCLGSSIIIASDWPVRIDDLLWQNFVFVRDDPELKQSHCCLAR
jgi:hypothetical protein